MNKLPKLETQIFETTLPVSGTTIQFRPYFVSEEKGFLTAFQSNDKKGILNNFKDLAKRCILKPEDFSFDNLTIIDFQHLILMLRAKSKGETADVRLTCQSCKKEFDLNINIEKCMTVINPDKNKIVVEVNSDLALELQPCLIDILDTTDEKMNQFDYLIQFLSHSIRKVIYRKKIYSDFSKEELVENVINTLTEKESAKIMENANDLVDIAIELKDVPCLHCSHKNSARIGEVFDFLA